MQKLLDSISISNLAGKNSNNKLFIFYFIPGEYYGKLSPDNRSETEPKQGQRTHVKLHLSCNVSLVCINLQEDISFETNKNLKNG